eukprot:scaffold3673_cov393-Prasinococcus_capsulatus_cf.AAC.11
MDRGAQRGSAERIDRRRGHPKSSPASNAWRPALRATTERRNVPIGGGLSPAGRPRRGPNAARIHRACASRGGSNSWHSGGHVTAASTPGPSAGAPGPPNRAQGGPKRAQTRPPRRHPGGPGERPRSAQKGPRPAPRGQNLGSEGQFRGPRLPAGRRGTCGRCEALRAPRHRLLNPASRSWPGGEHRRVRDRGLPRAALQR